MADIPGGRQRGDILRRAAARVPALCLSARKAWAPLMPATEPTSQDEPVYGWSRLPSVIPFEYDADGERRVIEEIVMGGDASIEGWDGLGD